MSKREHRVTFLSPGTLFDESTSKACGEWNPVYAAKLAVDITERHGARPYGFYFETYLTADPVPDGEGGTLKVEPKSIKKSGVYYIKGTLLTVKDAEVTGTLRSNMEGNDWPIVCKTVNGYSHVSPFGEGDFVIDDKGEVVERGDDPKHVKYRVEAITAHRQEMDRLYPRT